jgi:prevent-host-death family protein
MATDTASELIQQTGQVLERVKNGESITVTEHGRPVARLIPAAPSTGVPLLDEMIAQGRAIPASNPGPIPPTPPRDERDGDIKLSELLIRDREEERY